MTSFRSQMRYMNPYDLHKALINEYVLKQPGDTKILQRNTSKDRTDQDVLIANHKFLWDSAPETWEGKFAKKYYDKLFKEYCIGDLSLYKENKVALRWRIEQEVIVGKGQFICGNKRCATKLDLKTWEVNFAYKEDGEKKNALVKIRLCQDCSRKLNFYSKKREVKRLKPSKKRLYKDKEKKVVVETQPVESHPGPASDSSESAWDKHKPVETKSREEEMEDYLQELLL